MLKNAGRHKIKEPLAALFELYRKRGEIYRLIGSYDKAYHDFARMHAAAVVQGDEVKQADAIRHQGLVNLVKGEFEKAETNYNLALGKYLAHKNLSGQVECYNGLGKLMQYLEKNEKAYEYYASGLDICKLNGDKKNECKCLENIANCYQELGKEHEAIDILKELVMYYESRSDYKNVGVIYEILGSAYSDIKEYHAAIENLKLSEVIATKIGDVTALLNIFCFMGIAYFKSKQYEDAKMLFYKCYNIAYGQGSKYMQAVSLLNIGDVYNEMNETKKAREYLDKMISMDIGIPGLDEEAQRIKNELNRKEKEVN